MSERKVSSERRDESVPLIAKEFAKDYVQSSERSYKRRIGVNIDKQLKSSLKRASLTFVSTETQLFDGSQLKPISCTQSKSVNHFDLTSDQNNDNQNNHNNYFTNELIPNNVRNFCSESDLYELNDENKSQIKVCFLSLLLS